MRCFYQVEIAHIGVLHYYAKLQLNFASKRSGGWVRSSILDRVKGGNERNHASDGGKDGRTNYGAAGKQMFTSAALKEWPQKPRGRKRWSTSPPPLSPYIQIV